MLDQLAQNPWWWLAIAALLGIGELVTPGVFLIWIACAAAITGSLAMIAPIPVAAQLVIFALLSLLSVWAGRRWVAANPIASQDPMLNDRAARLIGKSVVVVAAISQGEGRVRVDDGTWTATGPDAPEGARMIVVSVNGAVLGVKPPDA